MVLLKSALNSCASTSSIEYSSAMKVKDFVVREWLAKYVVGELTLKELSQLIVLQSAGMSKADDVSGDSLIPEVELRLAEFSNGHWTEEDLKQFFRPLVQRYSTSVAFATVSRKVEPQIRVIQKRPLKVPA